VLAVVQVLRKIGWRRGKKFLYLPPGFAFWKKMVMDFPLEGLRGAFEGPGGSGFFA